jgi:radical SAM superfamily enzyme YgiQ (UPF0313 family)
MNDEVLIITGTPPNTVEKLKEMAMVYEPLLLLMTVAGKKQFHSSIPSLGATVLGSYLQKHGIQVKISDFYVDDPPDCQQDIIGISSTFCNLEDVADMVKYIEGKNPKATIVLGGALSWSMPPAQLFELIPGIDFIVEREGEQTFLELIKAIRKGS